MSGVAKTYPEKSDWRASLYASRYDDPRGGRPSALERNILRYRAAEVTLYLFYAEEVRDFLVSNLYRDAVSPPGASLFEPTPERRLKASLHRVLGEAGERGHLTSEESLALIQAFEERPQGKQVKTAIAHGIALGLLSEVEADQLEGLLRYRNDIAHRMHMVMADVTRSSWVAGSLTYRPPAYKGDALDRLRRYRALLSKRAAGKLMLKASFDRLFFEFAERTLEAELVRLDRLITRQIEGERRRISAVNKELSLKGTELTGDLHPRFPPNHRPGYSYGDDYEPPSGHLTPRGVEICYRLFDLGRSPLAVAYLMGMTLRSAERRRKSWWTAGGPGRVRAPVTRYDLKTGARWLEGEAPPATSAAGST